MPVSSASSVTRSFILGSYRGCGLNGNIAPFLMWTTAPSPLGAAPPANQRRQDEYDAELSHNGDMVTLDTLRTERREEILRLAGRRGAHSPRGFGSVARGEANENSDLDLLVAWEPGRSLMDHAGLVQDLQELLGIKVHVGTEKSLHWYARDRILRESTPL